MIAILSLNAKTFIIYILAQKIEVKLLINLLSEITILIQYKNYANFFFALTYDKVFKA